MLRTKFLALEPSSSGEEDFKYILYSNPNSRRRVILTLDPHLNKISKEPLGNATSQIISI